MIAQEYDTFFRVDIIGDVSYLLRMEGGTCEGFWFTVESHWITVFIFNSCQSDVGSGTVILWKNAGSLKNFVSSDDAR